MGSSNKGNPDTTGTDELTRKVQSLIDLVKKGERTPVTDNFNGFQLVDTRPHGGPLYLMAMVSTATYEWWRNCVAGFINARRNPSYACLSASYMVLGLNYKDVKARTGLGLYDYRFLFFDGNTRQLLADLQTMRLGTKYLEKMGV